MGMDTFLKKFHCVPFGQKGSPSTFLQPKRSILTKLSPFIYILSKCKQSLDSFRDGRRKELLQLTLKAETTQLMLEAPTAQKQVGKKINKAVMQKDVFFFTL